MANIRVLPTASVIDKNEIVFETLAELTELVLELREIHQSIVETALTQPKISLRVARLQRIADRYAERIDAATDLLIGRIERR